MGGNSLSCTVLLCLPIHAGQMKEQSLSKKPSSHALTHYRSLPGTSTSWHGLGTSHSQDILHKRWQSTPNDMDYFIISSIKGLRSLITGSMFTSHRYTLHVVWIGFVCRNWSRESAGPYSWPALVTHPTRIPPLKRQITAIHARSHMKCAHVMRLGYVLGAMSPNPLHGLYCWPGHTWITDSLRLEEISKIT